jgi:ADP-ribose pyrophosphatase YjhB (NUDIX family)
VLLVRNRRRDGSHDWSPPGGVIDDGESVIDGLTREVLEETGCVFTLQSLVGVYLGRFQRPARHEDVTYLRMAFSGTVGERLPDRRLDHGIVRTLWMSLAELRACPERHRSSMVLQCIEDHAAGRCYPLDLIDTHPSVYEPEIKA